MNERYRLPKRRIQRAKRLAHLRYIRAFRLIRRVAPIRSLLPLKPELLGLLHEIDIALDRP